MEQLLASVGLPGELPHTPDQFIYYMNDPSYGYPGGYYVDVTNEYPRLNPYVVRAIRVYPVNGRPSKSNTVVWANDYSACVELQNLLASVPHPSPLR
jgi:hypothetical protein